MEINCRIPITVRLSGELTDVEIEGLGAALARALLERIAFAEQTLATSHAGLGYDADRVTVREEYDAARATESGYWVPSYQRAGTQSRVPVQTRTPKSQRLWFIRKAVNFHAVVGEYLSYIESLRPEKQLPGKVLYYDLFDQLRWVSAWLVQVNRPIRSTELQPIVEKRAEELNRIRSNQLLGYGHAFTETNRQQLIAIDQDSVVGREIPDMSRNTAFIKLEGAARQLRPGSWVLVTTMVLPKIELADLAMLDPEILLQVRLRDLTFLVHEELFERQFHVSWKAYLQDFGDELVQVRIQPVTVRRRIYVPALQYLLEELVLRRIQSALTEDSYYFWRLLLLNNSTLEQLPPPLRPQAAASTNAATRDVDDSQAGFHWQPNWKGALILGLTAVSRDNIGAVQFGPLAVPLAAALLDKLNSDDSRWAWALLGFLERNFGGFIPENRPPGGTLFEYVLAEVERRGQLDTLFDKVEHSGAGGVHAYLIRLTLATRYATHARFLRSRELLNTRVLAGHKNVYRVADQEIWLDRDPDQRFGVGDVLGMVDPIYIFERKDQRMKPARVPEFCKALDFERCELMGKILRGEVKTEYTEEAFTREAIGAAAKRMQVKESDFEEVKIQRSLRLLSIEARTVEALPRFYVTFEFVERVVGERWQKTAGPITQIEDEFEARLIYWALGRAGEFYEAMLIAISVVGGIVIAWEAGLIAALIELGGGATAVAVSITLSEMIYLVRVVFGNAELTLANFLEAALDGYLMAVGFRGAGLVGRLVARSIGTESLTRIVGGWIAERLIVGSVGGAASAALTKFSHDLIRVATGKGGFSSIGDYVRDMTWGALFGTVFEFGTGALGPLLRASGENAFQTLAQVVDRVKAEGFTSVRWTALTTEALGKMRANLSRIMGDVAAEGFVKAMAGRLSQVTEQLGAEYRLAVFKRVLELSPEAMTREAAGGLETFLTASRADLTNEAALGLLNRLKPDQLRAFLESVNQLDKSVVGALSRTGQLDALATAPQTLRTIGTDPVLAELVAQTAKLAPEAAAARAGALARVAGRLPAVPESVTQGASFAKGGTSTVFEVEGRPDLLVKPGGGRLLQEARSMIELETLGIDTAYAGVRQVGGTRGIVLRKIDSVGSKDIIGRTKQRLNPPQNIDVVTQRTIDDLEKIQGILEAKKANIGDFQFLVRRSDGAVIVNDPAGGAEISVSYGRGPSGSFKNVLDSFRAILRRKQAGGPP